MHLVKKGKKEREVTVLGKHLSLSLSGLIMSFLASWSLPSIGRMSLTINRDRQTFILKPFILLMLDVCAIESKVHCWLNCILRNLLEKIHQ